MGQWFSFSKWALASVGVGFYENGLIIILLNSVNSYKRLPYKVSLNEELYTKQQYFGNYGKQLNQNIKKNNGKSI